MVASEKEKSELGAGMAYLRQATFSEMTPACQELVDNDRCDKHLAIINDT